MVPPVLTDMQRFVAAAEALAASQKEMCEYMKQIAKVAGQQVTIKGNVGISGQIDTKAVV